MDVAENDSRKEAVEKISGEKLKLLRDLGYDETQILSYCKAEKSWCLKGTIEWDVWSSLVKMFSSEK